MQRNICMGCMREHSGTVCPSCGFSTSTYTHPAQALPIEYRLRNRFLIGRVLGQGGFGITYIALDTVLNLRVAIKEYFPSSLAGRVPGSSLVSWNNVQYSHLGRENCMKEARKMAKIQNIPAVVNVRDVFEENETAYIIMDYVEGMTLRDKLRQEGSVSPRDCMLLLGPVMDALDRVHRQGLIHRDISPDNIMVDSDGTPHVLDLGAAKDLDFSSVNSTTVVKHGYSPPEQYLGTSQTGPWMDVYAMSATVYSMLTGQLPPIALGRKAGERLNMPNVPAGIVKVLDKGMALDYRQRYQTMGQLREALSRAIPADAQSQDWRTRWNPLVTTLLSGSTGKKYDTALALLQRGQYREAETAFSQLGSYRNSQAMVSECRYMQALTLKEAGEISTAERLFRELGDYRDCTQQLRQMELSRRYQEADALAQKWNFLGAAKAFQLLGDYRDSRKRSARMFTKVAQSISAGEYHSLALRSDGRVLAAGFQDSRSAVQGWTDMAAVSAGCDHSVGIRKDGTVIAVGGNSRGQCSVFHWSYVMDISNRSETTLGLRWDGTVLAAGRNDYGQCNVQDWREIEQISTGTDHSIGLRKDGTVAAVGSNVYGQCEVSGWTGIAAVSAGGYHTVGLREDGTVVAAGANIAYYGKVTNQCAVSGWRDIAAISAGQFHTVGLKTDGTVVAVGFNDDGQCEVSAWRDIIAVSAGVFHTIGLKADGTMVAAGSNAYGRCDVWSWQGIDIAGDASAVR